MPSSNTFYNDIMAEYDAIRLRNGREQEDRISYVNSHIDGFKELSDSIASLTFEHARRAIGGDKAALRDLDALIADLKDQKACLLRSAGYPEDYLSPIYNCPDCKDTGYIGSEKCHCFKERELKNRIETLYDQSNIRRSIENVSFDMVSEKYYSGDDLAFFRESKSIAMEFTKNFGNDYQNLLFYGTVGTGKSLLSSCIASELLSKGHSVIYFSTVALIDELAKKTFDKGDQVREKDAVNPVYDSELLIIDDLGTEMPNNFTVTAIFTLLNERALKKRPIIISTNLSLEELRDRYSDRVFSRLTGSFTFCRMSGPDIRIASKFN